MWVQSTTIEIYPSNDNKGVNLPLPTELLMSSVNYKNDLIFSYTQRATLLQDVYLGRDTHYAADLTLFIESQIKLEETNHNALVFTANDATFRSSLTRLYAGDQKNDRQMILKISCLHYEK